MAHLNNLSRSAWKKLRRCSGGLPQGQHRRCKCGGLLILQESATERVVHHSEPFCDDFLDIVEKAEFTTLAAATETERDEALGRL